MKYGTINRAHLSRAQQDPELSRWANSLTLAAIECRISAFQTFPGAAMFGTVVYDTAAFVPKLDPGGPTVDAVVINREAGGFYMITVHTNTACLISVTVNAVAIAQRECAGPDCFTCQHRLSQGDRVQVIVFDAVEGTVDLALARVAL